MESNMPVRLDHSLTPYTIHRNEFKMDERPTCEIGNHPNPRGEHRQLSLWPQIWQLLVTYVAVGKRNKSKHELLGLHQCKKLLHSEENKRIKRLPTEWEKMFVNDTSDKYSCVCVCVCVCVPHFPYPFLYWQTLRLLPYLVCCKEYCNKHRGAYMFSNWRFSFLWKQ